MPFNRFDVAAAAWTFAAEWHGGKSSAVYALFGTRALRAFKPGPLFNLRGPGARLDWAGARDNLARYVRMIRAGRAPFRDRRA